MLDEVQEAACERAPQNASCDEAVGEGESSSQSADLVSKQERWIVYLMIDPRGYRAIYVGLTLNGSARARAHWNDPSSAVYWYARQAEREGVDILMKAIANFGTRAEARNLEEWLIATIPGVLNRDVNATRKRLG